MTSTLVSLGGLNSYSLAWTSIKSVSWRGTYLEAVICPTTEFEDAGLLVERKILDVDLARRLVYGRRLPLDQTLVIDGGLGGQGYLKVAVRAAMQSTQRDRQMGPSVRTARLRGCNPIAVI